jgi:hypothetical protein
VVIARRLEPALGLGPGAQRIVGVGQALGLEKNRSRVRSTNGRPATGRKVFEIAPPIRFPSPAATMMAVTCLWRPTKKKSRETALGSRRPEENCRDQKFSG